MEMKLSSTLVAAALCAYAGLATATPYQGELTFNGSDCSDSDARLLRYTPSCVDDASCSVFPGPSGYTHQVICSDNYTSHAQSTLKNSSYVLMQVYIGADCEGALNYAVAVVPDGKCHPTNDEQGYSGYTATVSADGNVTARKFRDYPVCSSANFKSQVPAADTNGKECLYMRDFYDGVISYRVTSVVVTSTTTSAPSPTSADGTGGGAGSGSTSSAGSTPSPTSSSSSSSSSTVYIGIGAGCVVVLLLVVAICIRCRRKQTKAQPSAVDYATIGEGMANAGSYCPTRDPYATDPATVGVSTDRRDMATIRSDADASNLWMDRDIQNNRINLADITIGEELSRGGFGIVSRGAYQGQPVAVKQLLPARSQNMNEIESFLSEAKLLSKMKHPRIIQMVGVAWTSPNDLVLVTEFMDGGDLRGLLVKYQATNERTGFTASKLKIALHVIEAVSYLHGYHPAVVHRDLKSKNILLSSQLDAKVTDFGISRERVEDMTVGVGSWLWMAPEVLRSKSYDEKADIFSFGVVLSELDTHQLPYAQARGFAQMDFMNGVANGSLLVDFTGSSGDREVVALAGQCMALNPQDRPTAKDVYLRLLDIAQTYRG